MAATFNCAAGNTTCLIAAINSANSTTEADTINLAAGLYTLSVVNNTTEVPDVIPPANTNGLPVITSAITIIGQGATATILERHPSAPSFQLFDIAQSGVLTLAGLTLRNGNQGVRNNRGSLVMTDVIVKNNGQGLFNIGHGFLTRGHAVIARTTISDNTSLGLINSGIMTIDDSAIVRNHGRGGIINGGQLEMTNSTISFNKGDPSSDVSRSAFFALDGAALLTNTTIVSNDFPGGGIATLAGVVRLRNTILAGNQAHDCGLITFPIVSLGHNLIGDCRFPESDRHLPFPFNPRLGGLVDTGQPGKAYLQPFPDSLAIDGGDNDFCPPLDQRGKPRVDGDRDGSIVCDIGAVEFQPGEVIQAPDLLETYVSPPGNQPPTVVNRGGSLAIQDYVKNSGPTPAGNSTTQFYLSFNPVKESGDVLLGGRAVAFLAPGSSVSGNTAVTVPTSTPAGTYFVLACADNIDTVSENNETNNCRASGSLVIVK